MRLASLVPAILLALVSRPAAAAIGDECRWPPAAGTPVAPASVQVITHPVVGDLDGDTMPEIVFASFAETRDPDYGINGILRIISGSGCGDVATTVDPGCVTCFGDAACRSLDDAAGAGVLCSTCGLALADLDRDGFMEIIGLSEGDLGDPDAHRRLVIFDHRGQFKACSPAPPEAMGYFTHAAIADLDGDGNPEIVGDTNVFQADGSLRFSSPRTAVGLSTVADVDLDGVPEVILGQRVLRADGSILWDRPDLLPATPAVADLDGDCLPEIVLVTWHQARVSVVDGATGATRATTQLPGALSICTHPRPGQGGPPALGDVDGDCLPEIGVAGCESYSVLRFDAGSASLSLLWQQPTLDRSSRTTSSTFFDLDGDGGMEVLYNDELVLWRFDGQTGAVLESLPNTNYTLAEYPAIADVDADGSAEVVIASNNFVYCCDAGVRVLGDAASPWAPARALQNQHAYHVTNILDDGTIPAIEEPSWSRGNGFRSQSSPTSCEVPCTFVPTCSIDVAPAECAGPRASVPISGIIQQDDAAGAIAHSWSTDCPNGVFSDPTSLSPVLTLDGPPPCPQTCLVTLTLTTAWGATSSCSAPVTVRDDAAPLLTAPADMTLECDQPIPPPAAVAATDACDPAPVVVLHEKIRGGSTCPQRFTILRAWTATDACGNSATVQHLITIQDTRDPVLDGVPGPITLECDEPIPPPPVVTATDACDPAPRLLFVEQRLDGSCPWDYSIVRFWRATDACQNEVERSQRITVRDTRAPALTGVPADVTVECDNVPPPADVTATDACDPAPTVIFAERRIDGSCPGEYQLIRAWTATDACGNVTVLRQLVSVVDTTPPVITPSSDPVACLWPPNHWYICLDRSVLSPEIVDNCSGEVTWSIAACASDQPDNANGVGDGNTVNDCVILEDGEGLCARSERDGIIMAGRHYGIAIVAVDACGNASPATVVGTLYVPHDQSPRERECLNPTKVGCRPNQDIPCD